MFCCTLHNLCIECNDEFIFNYDEDNGDQDIDDNSAIPPLRDSDYFLKKKGEEKRRFVEQSFRYC